MSRMDEALYDFLKSEFSVGKLIESTDKAYGIDKLRKLNEEKEKQKADNAGEIKPAEITDTNKDTKVEKALDKETPDVDKLTQDKNGIAPEQKLPTKKDFKVEENKDDTDEEATKRRANKEQEDKINKKAADAKNEGKVPENPSEVDTKDGKYQGKLTEEKVLTTVSDETAAKDIQSKYPGSRIVSDKDEKGQPSFIIMVKEAKKKEQARCIACKKKFNIEDMEALGSEAYCENCAAEAKETNVSEAKKALKEDTEVNVKTDDKEINVVDVPDGGVQVTTVEKPTAEVISQDAVEAPVTSLEATNEPTEVEDEIVEECKCGKNKDKSCKCKDTKKKAVKEAKDDFTWGFTKSVQAALKQHNFTPSLEKVGDFLAKLPELELDEVKKAIVDNDKTIIASMMNSIATNAPFVVATTNTEPVEEPVVMPQEKTPVGAEMKKEDFEEAPAEEVAESKKKVQEAGIPVGLNNGDGFAKTEPVDAHEESETPAEEVAEHDFEITPEVAKELIVLTDLDAEKDLAEFTKGLKIEMEHFEDVEENKEMIAKIAASHIKEFPGVSYYDALDKMEAELKEENKEPVEGEETIDAPKEEPVEQPIGAYNKIGG